MIMRDLLDRAVVEEPRQPIGDQKQKLFNVLAEEILHLNFNYQ